MTNIWATPEKGQLRRRLFEVGVQALSGHGWRVERVQGAGKSSVRRISRDGESKLVSIRTTQDTWIAFPRDASDKKWVTLSDVDAVVAVSVDNRNEPRFAMAHFVDGDEMRARFDRAYRARKEAKHDIPVGRGMWVSLYLPEAKDPVNRVGAGAGLDHPPIARVPLIEQAYSEPKETPVQGRGDRLTIAEAKQRLALTLGVRPEAIKITIEA